jgi:hypothetical protein
MRGDFGFGESPDGLPEEVEIVAQARIEKAQGFGPYRW